MKGCGESCLLSTFENQAMLLHNLALQFQKGNSTLHLSRVVVKNALILKTQWLFNVFFYGALTTVFCIDFSLLKSCKNTHCSPKNKIKTKKPTPKHPTPNKTSKTPLPKLQRYCEVKEVIWSSVVYHPPPMELKVFKKHCLTVLS